MGSSCGGLSEGGEMPIRPENKARYPKDWNERRRAVLERAGGKCEFCGARNYEPHPITGSRVVLTIAHLHPPIEDCRLENLAALCQRDHLRYDRDQHDFNRRRNREERKRRVQPVLELELV